MTVRRKFCQGAPRRTGGKKNFRKKKGPYQRNEKDAGAICGWPEREPFSLACFREELREKGKESGPASRRKPLPRFIDIT